jgi:hypothetical protein
MLRETDVAQSTAEALQDVAPPQPEVAEAQFAAEGEIPQVAEGAATEAGETASEQAFGNKPTAETGQVDGGMYQPEEYRAACIAAGTPDKWEDRYARGHTEALGWTQPHDGRYSNSFELERGHSASQAVKDFLAGPTIADYRVIGVAIEMEELRRSLGDQQFDHMFGSKDSERDAQISKAQRLKITSAMYTIPFAKQMLELANEELAVAPLTEEAAAPAVEARVEEQPQEGGVTAPAPEMIADELGIQREQQLV